MEAGLLLDWLNNKSRKTLVQERTRSFLSTAIALKEFEHWCNVKERDV